MPRRPPSPLTSCRPADPITLPTHGILLRPLDKWDGNRHGLTRSRTWTILARNPRAVPAAAWHDPIRSSHWPARDGKALGPLGFQAVGLRFSCAFRLGMGQTLGSNGRFETRGSHGTRRDRQGEWRVGGEFEPHFGRYPIRASGTIRHTGFLSRHATLQMVEWDFLGFRGAGESDSSSAVQPRASSSDNGSHFPSATFEKT